MTLTTDQQRRNSPSGDAHRRLLRPRLQGPLEHQSRQARNILSGNIKGGSITVPLTSCLTGLESAV
jgi:hypothetical protein